MNAIQALAIAAAAFVVAGEAWSPPLEQAQARLAAFAVRGEAVTHRVFAHARAAAAKGDCGEAAPKRSVRAGPPDRWIYEVPAARL